MTPRIQLTDTVNLSDNELAEIYDINPTAHLSNNYLHQTAEIVQSMDNRFKICNNHFYDSSKDFTETIQSAGIM